MDQQTNKWTNRPINGPTNGPTDQTVWGRESRSPCHTEASTTFLLVMLFVPEFKVAFSGSLMRHYRDLVLFPNTLPWPGVRGSGVRGDGGGNIHSLFCTTQRMTVCS